VLVKPNVIETMTNQQLRVMLVALVDGVPSMPAKKSVNSKAHQRKPCMSALGRVILRKVPKFSNARRPGIKLGKTFETSGSKVQ